MIRFSVFCKKYQCPLLSRSDEQIGESLFSGDWRLQWKFRLQLAGVEKSKRQRLSLCLSLVTDCCAGGYAAQFGGDTQ